MEFTRIKEQQNKKMKLQIITKIKLNMKKAEKYPSIETTSIRKIRIISSKIRAIPQVFSREWDWSIQTRLPNTRADLNVPAPGTGLQRNNSSADKDHKQITHKQQRESKLAFGRRRREDGKAPRDEIRDHRNEDKRKGEERPWDECTVTATPDCPPVIIYRHAWLTHR